MKETERREKQMFLPKLQHTKKAQPIIINQFGGLNRSETISDNEFSDMKNCSGRKYPYVASRGKRKKLKRSIEGKIQAVSPLLYGGEDMTGNEFVGIVDGYFYYKNEKKSAVPANLQFPYPYNDVVKYPQYGGKNYPYSIVPFNGVYCIFPGYKQFNPITGAMTDLCPKVTISPQKHDSSGLSSDLMFVKQHSQNLSAFYYVYSGEGMIFPVGARFGNGYQHLRFSVSNGFPAVGDRVTIYYDAKGQAYNNCTFDSLDPELREDLYKNRRSSICSAYIKELEKYGDTSNICTIKFDLYNYAGNSTNFGAPDSIVYKSQYYLYGMWSCPVPVTIQKYMPPIVYACECGGRIWGLDPYGQQIMCCRAGNASDWSKYDGTASAPWFTEVATSGEWTGIAEFNGNVYCFKRDVCHVVYGDNATNFSIARTIKYGCIDSRSIKVIGNSLYFLSTDGFYVCSGSQAIKISDKLGKRYIEGIAGCDGTLYYCSCKSDDGWEFLCYDTEKNIWWKEDDTKAVGFFNYESKLYFASEDEIYMIGGGELPDEWSITSKLYDDGTSQMRSLCSMLFRLKIPADGDACVYVSYDGAPFEKCGYVCGGKLIGTDPEGSAVDIEEFDPDTLHKEESAYYQRFPVRFRPSGAYRFKLVCHGDVVLEAYERNVTFGGRAQR